MKCSNCSRLALYTVGDQSPGIPLCLSCYAIVEDISFRNWLKSAAMLNQAMDDMDAVMPLGGTVGRIPVADIAKATSSFRTYNNIHVTNSNVGVINTGNLAKIDAAITMSVGTDAEEFGARLKDLTDAVLQEASVDDDAKRQIVEVIDAIAQQASAKQPSATVIGTLFSGLRTLSSTAVEIATAVEKLYDAWTRLGQ
ncbi:hypothetical protein SAMN05880561_101315 [Rhizobium sp. RU33A]|jgi:hypothetical protein|uniref:hypothetical protein n=1 Tax=Rhizobium sp. RU33A TaxID=1907413 RepID=UPI000956482B|nr:hypothetical protein [Rhizobium sp. RU33A]SIP93611.1 hypothetical protein SAMN05880561_101315 [Rhizobium sp. RU33A]